MIGYCYSFDNGFITRTGANDSLVATNNPKVVYNISVGVWIATLCLYLVKTSGTVIGTSSYCAVQLIFDTTLPADAAVAANGVINCYAGSISGIGTVANPIVTLNISGPVIITKAGKITSWGTCFGFNKGTSPNSGMQLYGSFLRIA
jgi:hypothetical protein